MPRPFGAIAYLSVLIAALGSCESESANEPTLGLQPVGSAAVGFGVASPAEVFNGGDPTGRFTSLHWSNWGQEEATASGIGFWVDDGEAVAEGHPEPVSLVAFDLTTCDGRRAYRRVAAFFPTKGQSFDRRTNGETQYDLCNDFQSGS